MDKATTLPVVGWREWLSLPDLGVPRIKAKVDTGARTSALHAFDVEEVVEHGRSMVRFVIHPLQRNTTRTIRAEAPLVEHRWVRSSDGRTQLRPVIETYLRLGKLIWPVELTLTQRDVMGFRMLLGRQAIRRRFLVDPGRSYVASRRRKRPRSGGKA